MLRSNAFARVAAGAVQAPSTHPVSHLTRTFQRLSLAPRLNSRGAIAPSLSRGFATKVVKRKSTKKKTAVASKSRPAAKKPAPKKKKTPARPKRKVVRKKVVVKPKKKVPTEKQKLTAAKKKERDELKQLKETALLTTAPKQKAASAWNVYVSEALGGSTGGVTGAIKETATKFKTLSASELEHYNHIANQNKAANEKAYADWVKKYTPEQIRLANNARALLKRRAAKAGPGVKRTTTRLSKIKDDRQVKRPITGYFSFATERRNSGDFKNIKLSDAAKLITGEWKDLSVAEKKKYNDLHTADTQRYQREYQSTYGHPTTGETKAARASA